jgi:hypothetical protein
MRKALIFLLTVAAAAGLRASEVTKAGTTAVPLLKVDVGAHAVGMGSAYVSLAEDATAMYWNPAGLARVKGNEAVFSHAQWFADIRMSFAGVAVNLGDLGTLGVSGQFETMDEMERTTILEPDGTGEMFGAGSFVFGLSYARKLTDRFSIGMSGKFINERIYHSTAKGAAIDVGALFDTQFHGMKLGMSITNYGTKMRMGGRDMQTQMDPDPTVTGNNANIPATMKTDAFDLPLLFRVGVSMDVLKGIGKSNLIVSADAMHPNDDVESMNVGCEYVFDRMVSLRAGYKSMFARDSEEGLSLGAGLKYSVGRGVSLAIDYAYREFGRLNDVQKFTIGLGF